MLKLRAARYPQGRHPKHPKPNAHLPLTLPVLVPDN
jgi:hypothetical protein